jgi:hypothetical protein
MSSTNSDQPPTDLEGHGYWKLSRCFRRLEHHGGAAIFNRYSDLLLLDLHFYSAELYELRKKWFGIGSNDQVSAASATSPRVPVGHTAAGLTDANREPRADLFSSVNSWSDAERSDAIKYWRDEIRPVLHPFCELISPSVSSLS